MIEKTYEESKKNSIGEQKKVPFKKKIKKILASSLVVLLAITSGVGMCACDSRKYDLRTQQEANQSVLIASKIIKEHGYGGRTSFTIDEYREITEINEDNFLPFVEYLGFEEGDKIAIVLGYDSVDDFMIQKGYVDEFGKPAFYLWEDEYVNGKIR